MTDQLCVLEVVGNYTREEAIAAIDSEHTLPDVLSLGPSKPAKLPQTGCAWCDRVSEVPIFRNRA